MDEKKVYQEKMQEQLKEWAAKIDALLAKAEKADAKAKSKYQEQIHEVQEKKKLAEEKLHELIGSGEETWGEVKEAFEKISVDVRVAFKKFLHGEETR
ncbi:MAG: hypothetical protein A2Y65_05385 [Deltaproteobacteria bacterium RBG_13_52_11]|nr:MAG: hypothetical protein A2Y65_05385 [Deltaproteobacteria bacterium RBG_13_52_11]